MPPYHSRSPLADAFVAALVVALAVPPALAQPFEVLATPNPIPERSLLRGVAGLSMNGAWAVGDGSDSPDSQNRQFTLHWDGSGWTQVPAPHHNTFGAHYLFGVAAAAPDWIWAVGTYGEGGGRAVPQVLRWDGEAWAFDAIPEIYSGTLEDVFAISASDVWAVGSVAEVNVNPPLALHWDGSSWERVPVPPVSDRDNDFGAVHASAPDNVWAVGDMRFWPQSNFIPLVMRWDGSSWTDYPLPAGLIGTLLDVVTFGPDDTWVALDTMTEGFPPLVLHWDGSDWTSYEVGVGSFAPITSDELYAFSSDAVYQWDGASWSVYHTFEGLSSPAFRNSAGVFLDGALWAVGRTIGEDDVFRTLAVRGIAESRTATPEEPGAEPAAGFALSAAYPNPAAGATTLTLTLPEPLRVRAEVYDLLGRRVRTLHDGALGAGPHSLSFDGGELPRGVYLVRVTGEDSFQTRRVSLLK